MFVPTEEMRDNLADGLSQLEDSIKYATKDDFRGLIRIFVYLIIIHLLLIASILFFVL
jgi:t-SNARE complex subunit (syntaxin)